MDVHDILAAHIYRTNYDDLSEEAIHAAKGAFLDTLGVAIAGSGAYGVREAVDLCRDWGGKQESSILVYGVKVPSPFAAFCNSMMVHALDYDDNLDQARLHVSVAVIPAALAAAESMKGTTGKDLINAIVLGADLSCRLSLALDLDIGWHQTSVLGTFGAAASASKLFGLNEKEIRNALGIAYGQAAGNIQGREDRSLIKRIQPGFASKAGILASCLARKGITGSRRFIDGPHGLFRLYGDNPSPGKIKDACEDMVKDLGAKMLNTDLAQKPYPCCRGNHGPIDLAISLKTEKNIRAADIKHVIVRVPGYVANLVGRPFEIGDNPQVDAQFNLEYTVSVALLKGRVLIQDFEEQNIKDPSIREMINRIELRVFPGLEERTLVPVSMEIQLNDGKTYSKDLDILKGNPENPMTLEERMDKFRDCARYAALPLNEDKVNYLIRCVEHLEDIKELYTLTEGMTGAAL